MAHDDCVRVILNGRTTLIRASIICRYLPVLWRRYVRGSATSLRPAQYLNQVQMNQYTRRALQDLFEYLEEIDIGVGKSAHLRESLEDAWDARGLRRARRDGIFFALSRIFRPDNFGCSKEIFSTMESFVIHHATEILKDSSSAWAEYILALHEIGAGKRFDLKKVLLCFGEKGGSLHDIDDIRWTGNWDPGALTKIGALIKQSGIRSPQFNVRFFCVNCSEPIRPQEAWNFDWQRGNFPFWAGCVTDDPGPLEQCDTCFRAWGPVSALDRWGLPRAREACFLHHAAHEDNYETECTPRGFGDVHANTPRFMQPVVHDAGHWHPRPGHWVEVMT